MYIKKIDICGFRNQKSKTSFSFTNSKNIIFGPNGSGKTSILEAIYLLGFGRSFLNVKKEELRNIDSNEFFISSSVVQSDLEYSINASLNKNFSLFLDGEKTGISGIGQNLFPLFFSSNDYVSLISSKSSLRKLFDKFIFGINNLYSDELLTYKKIIRNKSVLLKQRKNMSHLRGWNKLLADHIVTITKKRVDFVQNLNHCIQKKYSSGMEIRYTPSVPDFNNAEILDHEFVMNVLDRIVEKEIAYKNSICGTHLDKYEIFLENRPLRLYSSGEKKINLLYVYLGYIDLFLKEREEYPVFLVDDYDIAMDEKNIDLFMSKYPEMQIIATSVRNNTKFETIIKLNT